MNQTVINSVYPKLVPMIAKANAPIDGVIDVFHGMGGEDNWVSLSTLLLVVVVLLLRNLSLAAAFSKFRKLNELAGTGQGLSAQVHEAEFSHGQDRLRAVV